MNLETVIFGFCIANRELTLRNANELDHVLTGRENSGKLPAAR